MNDIAKNKARQVELEFILLQAWKKLSPYSDFVRWLEEQLDRDSFYWKDEVKELIALWEGNTQ